jgi:hypothetical protein
LYDPKDRYFGNELVDPIHLREWLQKLPSYVFDRSEALSGTPQTLYGQGSPEPGGAGAAGSPAPNKLR